MASEYAALTVPLDLPMKVAAEQEVAVAAVRQCLGQRGKWLLIFDNAAAPQDLTAYRPQGGDGPWPFSGSSWGRTTRRPN